MNFDFPDLSAYFWCIPIFVVLIIAFVAWIKFFFSEDNQTKIVTSKIKKYFGFLFEHGFKIDKVDVNGPNGAWMVVLRSEKCKIRIIEDRSYISCEIAPTWVGDKQYLSLPSILADIESKNKKSFIVQARKGVNYQLDFYGQLLRSHYNQVSTFIDNYPRPFFTTFE